MSVLEGFNSFFQLRKYHIMLCYEVILFNVTVNYCMIYVLKLLIFSLDLR